MEMTGPFGRTADRYWGLPARTIGTRPFKTILGNKAQCCEQQDLEVDFPLQTNLRLSKRKNEGPLEYDRITERHARQTHKGTRSPDICKSSMVTRDKNDLTFIPVCANLEASADFEDCSIIRQDYSNAIINTFSSRSRGSRVQANRDIGDRDTATNSPQHTPANNTTEPRQYGKIETIRAGRKADSPKHTINSINLNGWNQEDLVLSTRPAETTSIFQNAPSITEDWKQPGNATAYCISSAYNLERGLNTNSERNPPCNKPTSLQKTINFGTPTPRRETIDSGANDSFFQTINQADQFNSGLSPAYYRPEPPNSICLSGASNQTESISVRSRKNESRIFHTGPNAQKRDNTCAIESIPAKYGEISGSDFRIFQPEFATLITSVQPKQALPGAPDYPSTYGKNQSDTFETTDRSSPDKEVRQHPVFQQATEPGMSTRGDCTSLPDYAGMLLLEPLCAKSGRFTREEQTPTRTFTGMLAEPHEPATIKTSASLSAVTPEHRAIELSRSADSTRDRQSGNKDGVSMPTARQPSAAIETTGSFQYATFLQSHSTPELPGRPEADYAPTAAQNNLSTVSPHNETLSPFKSPEMTLPNFDKKERSGSRTLSTQNSLHGLSQSARKSSQNEISPGHNRSINEWADENQLQTGRPDLWAADKSSTGTGRNAANRNDNSNNDSFVPEEGQNKNYNHVSGNPDPSDVEMLTEKVYERIMRTIEQEFERGW